MKYRLASCVALSMLSLSIHAQDHTTKEVDVTLQQALSKNLNQMDTRTVAHASATTGLVIGEYTALVNIATVEQGGSPSCIPAQPDTTRILKDVSHAMETDDSLDKEANAGIMEALMSAYPCLIPQAFKSRAMEGKR
jgi:Rap1a immunity proteins